LRVDVSGCNVELAGNDKVRAHALSLLTPVAKESKLKVGPVE
jgi:hypothetical protein